MSAALRLPAERLWMGALLRAIAKVPDGEKLNVRALREPLGIGQIETLAALELMVAEGRLDRTTLRPPLRPEVEPVAGPELAREIEAYAKRHGLARTRLSEHLFGYKTGIARLHRRNKKPQAKTIAKVRALLAAPPPAGLEGRPPGGPPLDDLKPRNAWTTRRENQRKLRERVAIEVKGGVGLPARDDADACPAPIAPRPPCSAEPPSFEEQLARVRRGEVGIAANLRIGRPDPSGTLGGVTGEINL